MDSTHFLALKVMRLTRPSFVTENPLITFDPRDLFAQPAPTLSPQKCAANQRDIAEGASHQKINLSEMLSLPQNFGNIYLGETFSAYVSVHNDCNFLCRDIIVKADLQTNSSKVPMTAGTVEPVSELPPDRSIDEVLTHEVKELGPHILVCTVSYTSHSSEKLYFKKYFKFQVQRPLDVKTDFRTTESDEVFLEAKIQNITSGPIFLEKVFLESSPHFQLLDTPAMETVESSGVRIPECLREQEIRQFLYRLRPVSGGSGSDQPVSPSAAATSLTVGKLDITWRSQMGQRARLQTSPLSTALAPTEDIRVTVEDVPAVVRLDSLFRIGCRVTNNSTRSVQLRLSTSSQSASSVSGGQEGQQAVVQFCGKVARTLDELRCGESASLTLDLLPLVPGLQAISGLVLTDTLLNRAYEFDELAQVLVQP